jgi:predicted ATP-binding protein involved in virulence
LIYDLIFRTSENSLILIDEPEISLHIDWQYEFINDIKQIAELNKMNMFIATHSPSIVGDHYNLTINLTKGDNDSV